MLRSILIGIDNTPSGIAAQELGVRWAKRFDARLAGMIIVDSPAVPFSEEVVWAGASDSAAGHARSGEARPVVHDGRRLLENHFAERCRQAGVEFELIGDVGLPHVQIVVEAQNHDIILLGQSSCFEFGCETDPGQTIGRVIQECPRPVVAAPAASGGGESIVVAYDGSLEASRALLAFEASGLGRGADVHVVAVAALRQDETCCAERAIAFLRSHGIEATPEIVETSLPPAESILKQVQRLDAGLLVIGAYGQPVLRELFLGSVTRTILKECRVPVFCFH